MTFDDLLKLDFSYHKLTLEEASINNGEVILYFSKEGGFEGKQLKIHFTDYTTATMHNESYFAYSEKDGEFDGHVFKRSDHTSYLDYVRANTFSEEVTSLALRHYRFCSSNEFFDILTGKAPEISLR
ncbi:MAG: hypothetical protein KBC57_12325 [Neisseriaceae bacterium]|nr:hypothetical protein [Neisseriaceae bacterium]MBP6863124.1 hypothetical protein [Neisseriaceae bacterium]